MANGKDPYAEFQTDPYAEFQTEAKAGSGALPPAPTPGFFKSLFSDIAGMVKGTPQAAIQATPLGAFEELLPEKTQESLGYTPLMKDTRQKMEAWERRKAEGYSVPYRVLAPVAETLGVNVPGMEESAKQGSQAGVLGHAAALPVVMATTHAAGKVAGPVLSKVGELRRATIAPREVPIAGEKVPVLVGEAAPETKMGRIQTELKRAGAGEQSFKDFATKQQAKVKQVIRNTAQQTSGMVGPMPGEAGEAMQTASEATFAKARPMYNELDKALVTVPDAMENVSAVTKQAIARAKRLGVEVTEGGGQSVTINGRVFTPETDPVAWQNLQQQGLVPTTTGQPLTTYLKVRSELLKMARMTKDPAVRYTINNEVKGMNANMDAALKGTPLADSWREASRLWSKGYAIREVANALKDVTKGTPPTEQAAGLSKVPTRIQGRLLVERLNDLAESGDLQKAFTPEEAKNLRKAADILDRGSMAAGREFGYGYTAHSTLWRNLVKLPAQPLVRAMTTVEGAEALDAAGKAKSIGEFDAAIRRFGRVAAMSSGAQTVKQPPQTAGEAKALMAQ